MSFKFFESAEAEALAARNAEFVADTDLYVGSFIRELTSSKHARLYSALSECDASLTLTKDGLIILIPTAGISECRHLPLADKIVLTGGYRVIGLHGVKNVPVEVCLCPDSLGIPLEQAAQIVTDLCALCEGHSPEMRTEEDRNDDFRLSCESLKVGQNFFILPIPGEPEVGHYGCVITDGKNGFAIPDLFAASGVRILPLSKVNLKAVKEDALAVSAPVEAVIEGAVCKAFNDLYTIALDAKGGNVETRSHHYTDHDVTVALVCTKHNLALRAPNFYNNAEILELTTRQKVDIAEEVWHHVDVPNVDQAAWLMMDDYLSKVVKAYNHVFNKQEEGNGKN